MPGDTGRADKTILLYGLPGGVLIAGLKSSSTASSSSSTGAGSRSARRPSTGIYEKGTRSMASHDPRWLDWARRLQAIAQTGRAYTNDVYDRERFDAVQEIAAEILGTHTAMGIDTFHALWEHEEGYATPKIDVRGVVFRGDALLLVRELSDGRWTLPGGWADVQNSPAENVVREIREESGILTRAVKLLAVYDRRLHAHVPLVPHHVYKMFFRCEIIADGPLDSVETSEAAFFREHELPELSIARVVPAQIHRFFEHLRNPEWPTDFD